MKKIIKTEAAPAPIGPYNQAVRAGETLYVSGQIALDPQTGELLEGSIEAETELVMENLKAVLKAAGADFSNVVKSHHLELENRTTGRSGCHGWGCHEGLCGAYQKRE